MEHIKEVHLIIIILILGGNVMAQLPDFTLLDTGPIYEDGEGRTNLSAIIVDADNDGDLDPVIGNSDCTIQVVLYKNERENIYRPETFLHEFSKAFPVRFTCPIGDIDNDGDIDVVGQVKWSPRLGVFINDGYGNFVSDTSFNVPNSLDSFYPVLLDLNEDGFLDLIRFDPTVVVLYNNGNGEFINKTKIGEYEKLAGYLFQHSMSWADADNDGDMDVYCGMTNGKNIFFINTGSGLEQVEENHITLRESGDTPSVNWIDYDNDGDMDLFLKDEIFENLGNLEFTNHVIVDEKYDSDSVWTSSRVWGDLDNDGDLDLFLSVENNPLPLPFHPGYGQQSAHPYNLLYLNEGNGEFTNVLNHGLTLDDSHTAEFFDQDNDGDLDVLTIGKAWKPNGHNQLYINEGNVNSSMLINCVDRYNCATPYGTRLYAKTMINGEYVSQTREITPVDGNLSFAHTRIHFGLGDAETVDSVIIRWPSGHIDTILNVPANQFYTAIEDSTLLIDYKATSYIQLNPGFIEVGFSETGESVNIDLKDHYKLIIGDTIPEIIGDTLEFVLHSNENSDAVNAALNGGVLTLNAGSKGGTSTIRVIASAGFTQRMDQFTVSSSVSTPSNQTKQSINIFPNPVKDIFHIELKEKGEYLIDISSINGQQMYSTIVEETTHLIDLSSFQKGIYFITIRNKDFVTTRKIIKL